MEDLAYINRAKITMDLVTLYKLPNSLHKKLVMAASTYYRELDKLYKKK